MHQGLKAPGNKYGQQKTKPQKKPKRKRIFVAQAIIVYLLCCLVPGERFSGMAEGECYTWF